MSEVKWIKLSTSIFDNRKIKQIECLPDGYAIIVVWLKLMCLAGSINDSGLIYFTNEIPYTDQMLAQQFGMPLATVQLALSTFSQFGMIEVIDNMLHISNWEKYQSADKLAEIREYNRLAQQKSRAKRKLALEQKSVNDMSLTCQPCQDTDIDKDKDIEEEIEYISIVSYLNQKAGTKFKASSEKTKRLIKARWNEGFRIEDFKTVIDKKCSVWIGTDMEKYLRPETLFGTKFEGYLNERNKTDGYSGNNRSSIDYGTVF